jgi:glycosyltransferase involved in cell wall biosynthesis
VKILFLSHYALPHVGGIEAVVDALARELARRGHDVVHLASAAVRSEDPPAGAPEGYRVVRVPAWNGPEERAEVPWPVFGPALWPALRREVAAADVVHAHGYLNMSSVLGLALARAGRNRRAVRVLTEHVGHVAYESAAVDRLQRAAAASVGRLAANLAEGTIVLNGSVEATMRALAPARPVWTVPNGVDSERYRPAAAGERARLRAELGWDDRPRVAFVGRLVAKKGADLAVRAAELAAGRFELVVAGPGSLDVPPGAAVSLLGQLTPDRVARLYRAADVLLLPSRGEGFPVTAQEAMASGLPVVMSDDPSYRPYLDGTREAATLVEPSPDALVAALDRLLGDAALRERAGAEAVAHARRAFSWRHAADEHERIYRSLSARRSP